MEAKILSVSKQNIANNLTDTDIQEIEQYSGMMAGVCYMHTPFFDSPVTDPEKSQKRFKRVAETGHHSIADHSFVTVLFENIPKMTAMILNSVGFYNTSEKSGRYTVMSDDNEKYSQNQKLYHKWVQIFEDVIKSYDSEIDNKLREKLSLENARYMLSVFAPSTTMTYTTSIRMWSYIRQFCSVYISCWDDGGASLDLKRTKFNNEVLQCIKDLYNCITRMNLYDAHIVDNKARNFQFLAKQTDYNIWNSKEHYDENYLIKYKVSFASLAQLHRHRTLKYFMCYDGSEESRFYVPRILRGTDLEKEWLEDLNILKETYPIATLVDVVETGLITDFMYKCDERLCGRTQLETMDNCIENLIKFDREYNKSKFMEGQLKWHIKDGIVLMKCNRIHCKEPCYWGPIKTQRKLI
ncbi:MAG: FAD-dependent thymidylate synthase [Methanobrevibacter sp.]|nr:FAD-dependent thymidylate synthase [Methanobrevibacter sp.]